MNKIRFLLVLLVLFPQQVWAEEAQEAAPFQAIMHRAGELTAADGITAREWNDLQLEKPLAEIMGQIRKLTGRDNQSRVAEIIHGLSEENKGFARLAKFRNTKLVLSTGHLSNSFFITRKGEISHASNSVIIADESIDVGHANHCLIIARGVVKVGHGNQNIVLAGHYADIAHDRNNSIIIAGFMADISHINNSVVCVPGRVEISHADQVVFINPPADIEISHEQNSQKIIDKTGILPLSAVKSDLFDNLQITQIVTHRLSKYALAVIKVKGREMLMRIGDTVVNPDDITDGWRLIAVEDNFVLYGKDGQYASAYINVEK